MAYTEKNQPYVPYQTITPQDLGNGITRRMMAYNDTMMCVENTFEVGAVGALHSHPHTQITYVVSGVFTFEIDGTHYTIKQGDTLLKTANQIHGCACVEAGALMDIFTPMREDFV